MFLHPVLRIALDRYVCTVGIAMLSRCAVSCMLNPSFAALATSISRGQSFLYMAWSNWILFIAWVVFMVRGWGLWSYDTLLNCGDFIDSRLNIVFVPDTYLLNGGHRHFYFNWESNCCVIK